MILSKKVPGIELRVKDFIPPSVNKCYYTDRKTLTRHKSKELRDFIEICGFFFRSVDSPIDYPIIVDIEYTVPDKRKRDVDNMIKPLLDTLKVYGVIKDDSIIQQLTAVKKFVKGEKKTRIIIYSIDNGKTS